MKTKEDIIIETVKHYTVDGNPRSTNGYNSEGTVNCVYHGPNGEECAFQRVLTEEGKQLTKELENVAASGILQRAGYGILKEEYYVKEQEFWNSVQKIHDWGIPQGIICIKTFDETVDWSIVEEGIKGTGIVLKEDCRFYPMPIPNFKKG